MESDRVLNIIHGIFRDTTVNRLNHSRTAAAAAAISLSGLYFHANFILEETS